MFNNYINKKSPIFQLEEESSDHFLYIFDPLNSSKNMGKNCSLIDRILKEFKICCEKYLIVQNNIRNIIKEFSNEIIDELDMINDENLIFDKRIEEIFMNTKNIVEFIYEKN